ncbi:TonB-dependent receptor domain-containing protein [Sphingomonas sp. TDK1]|uniref:TonB-dependent receptor domain-containing protein n=1 Tax=Sphingomonas sp. TDK1 TaxID=453247 RepID=UPI0007DA3A01|nr:TonB-dependent receptor [Sphingomonas sp. TDK1]OAN64061.1 TonB-dependent receptor [Sphingomonas sp. TDK1]
MTKSLGLASLLLFSSALVAPAIARAQTAPATPEPQTGPATSAADQPVAAQDAQQEDTPDVSVPGEIVVTGRRANLTRDIPQVVSVLSAADIQRTGEGDIAGALGRVTGLSVVGNGYVFVRGLGDRYSLALLNGSPLPSPEPLKRVVPLDLFPTTVVSSSLVQKSYSVNYPGEFGGGVINLTTNAAPKQGFVTISGGIGGNSRTTGQLGYVYAGGGHDWTGFDDGSRNLPPALQGYFDSGARLSSGTVDSGAIAKQLVTGKNGLLQRNANLPPNWSASLSAGKSWDVGENTLGLIATAGYSNKWTVRDSRQQYSITQDLSVLESDFERVLTDNRVVLNGLFGMGFEFGDNKLRWTSVYIRDTLKNSRLGIGKRHGNDVTDFQQQDTRWFERQLIDTQLVGEFKLTPNLSLDLRGSYANSKRKSPSELFFEYVRTNVDADPYGKYFINRLNNGNGGDATVSYSNLNEDLYSAGADLTFKPITDLSLSVGYSYLKTKRFSSRRDFQFSAPSTFPNAVAMLRPDLLLGSGIIDFYKIQLIETNEGNPAFNASLRNHAGYGRAVYQITPELSIDTGVRYETAKEKVTPAQVFKTPGASTAGTNLNNDYWLPAATLTWQFRPKMQFRLNGSKTIARPQFRELIYQFYFDPETNRQYQGNPLLQDSTLYNGEGRFEWYISNDQRVSAAAFYKRIDKPIEAFITGSDTLVTSYANAPKADLYGAEVEAQKKFGLGDWLSGPFFTDRDLLLIANYTYTKSKLKVQQGDRTAVYAASSTNATDYFRDGAALTGQSDHLVNLQLGMEKSGLLSQQTFILSYASKRVTSRGIANQNQPDVYEYPGFNLDFVARQGVMVAGHQFDVKFEARNLTGRRYKELQSNGTRTVVYNRYSPGTTVQLSLSTSF